MFSLVCGLVVWFLAGQELCLFFTAFCLAQGPTHIPVIWVFGAVNQLGCEADHSSPSNAEVKNMWSYAFTPQYAFISCTRRLNVFIVAVSSNFCKYNLPAYITVQSLKLFFCVLLIQHIRKELQIEVEDISADYILDCWGFFFLVIVSFLILFWSLCKVRLCWNIANQN